ncbi:MAG: DUF485 domain-containing protein [Ktedonobacteraceae bacterium]
MSEVVSTGDGAQAIRQANAMSPGQSADVNWTAIEGDRDFQELVREKRNFIIPATIFFLVYYFGFLIIVGYFPALVDVNVIGNINLAYLFALSQFIMAWVIVYLYVRRAGVFDRLANAIVVKVKGNK